jgi:hypothetical protein
MHVYGIVCLIVVAQSSSCSRLTWLLQQTGVAPAAEVMAAAESIPALCRLSHHNVVGSRKLDACLWHCVPYTIVSVPNAFAADWKMAHAHDAISSVL